jgi:dihydrofolate reductase
MGATLIMGRRTYESLPPHKLPGRNLIILTEGGGTNIPRIRFIPSLEEALHTSKDDRVFVIGGATVFEQALPWADEVLITRVLADVEGDTFFPPLPNRFRLMNIPVELQHEGDEYKTRNEMWSAT